MIYKIHSNDSFTTIFPDMKEISIQTPDREAFLKAKNTGAGFEGSWVELDGILEDKKPLPDISRLTGQNMVFSPRAYDLLSEELEKYGEFLPVLLNGEVYKFFRCLNLIDKVDLNNSCLNNFDEAEKMHFISDDVNDQLLWSTKYGKERGLFCSDIFKNLIEENNLTGLSFNDNLISRK